MGQAYRTQKHYLYDYPLVQLQNIRDNGDEEQMTPDMFVDINMLITTGVTHSDTQFLYTVMNQDQMDLLLNGDFTRFSDVKPYLNGFGRILHYTALKTDTRDRFNPLMAGQNNIVNKIVEGRFRNGNLDGFGRIISDDGYHQIGFFRNGHPYGKLQSYRGGFLLQQGIWTYAQGESLLEKEQKLYDFVANQEPSLKYYPDD